jgi:hypothetical protein
MSHHKPHYPVQAELKRKAHQIASAINTLARLGIEVKAINVEPPIPVITVFHCPANKRLYSEVVMRSNDKSDQAFVIKNAKTDNCKIVWTEAA